MWRFCFSIVKRTTCACSCINLKKQDEQNDRHSEALTKHAQDMLRLLAHASTRGMTAYLSSQYRFSHNLWAFGMFRTSSNLSSRSQHRVVLFFPCCMHNPPLTLACLMDTPRCTCIPLLVATKGTGTPRKTSRSLLLCDRHVVLPIDGAVPEQPLPEGL